MSAGAALRVQCVQLALLMLDALPDRFVASSWYPGWRGRWSATPVRFQPSGAPTADPHAGEWPGRRLASGDTDLVVEGFPGSANSYLSNSIRESLRRPANVESHFHYTAQLRRALSLGVPCLVVVREPAAACRSLLSKEPLLAPALAVWRWWRFHRFVQRRRELSIVFFEDVVRDLDCVLEFECVRRLVDELPERPALRRASKRPGALRLDWAGRSCLRRCERLYDALRRRSVVGRVDR